MNFELKALSLGTAATLQCDLLVLPVTEKMAAKAAALEKSGDALSQWIAAALAQGDASAAAGKQLHGYQVSGVQARRVLLLGAGQGSARELRSALAGAASFLKAEGVAHAAVCLSAVESPDIAIAVQSLHEALYQYRHTKPSAKAVALKKVTLGVANKRSASAAFALGQALATGQTLAKEWGNRPANHATPTHLAQAAQDNRPGAPDALQNPRPQGHRQAGHERFLGRGPRHEGTAAIHRTALPGRGQKTGAGGFGGQGHHF